METPKGYPLTKTVGGRPVIIYNIYSGGAYPVHGAYWSGDEDFQWVLSAWTLEGRKVAESRSDLDLIESFVKNEAK